MDRTRMTGILIMAGAAFALAGFLVGLVRRSYLAVAVPVALALVGLSALAGWVGWTMMTSESDVPEPEEEAPTPTPA